MKQHQAHLPASLDLDNGDGDGVHHDHGHQHHDDDGDDFESLGLLGGSSSPSVGSLSKRRADGNDDAQSRNNPRRDSLCALSLALGLALGVAVRHARSGGGNNGGNNVVKAETLPPELSYVHASWHPRARSLRFPSVDDRVRMYMSNWYVPPCRVDGGDNTAAGSVVDIHDAVGATANLPPPRPSREPHQHSKTYAGLIWYRWHYDNLQVLRDRDLYNDTETLFGTVAFEPPAHYAGSDLCDNVHVTTEVSAETNRTYWKHNLYVLDWYAVHDCAETKHNHHAPYCRDSLEMVEIMDKLEGRTERGEPHGTNLFEYCTDEELECDLGLPTKMINERVPIIVRYGDTIGELCDLPIFGKTRVAAAAGGAKMDPIGGGRGGNNDSSDGGSSSSNKGPVEAVIREAAATTEIPFARAATTTPDDIDGSVLETSCYAAQLEIPRPTLRTVDPTFLLRYSPIVWDFHSIRTNQMLREILEKDDVPWEEKRPVAFWRGALTGARQVFHGRHHRITDEEVCRQIPRCQLVLNYHKSELVDARLTHVVDVRMADTITIEGGGVVGRGNYTLGKHKPKTSTTVRLFVDKDENGKYEKMSYGDQLKAKALIVMEGNDLATSLRWSLLSRSVVLMPPPTRTSWAMEEWLEPWIHYVPINANLTNVEERMLWIISNDEEAQRIAERATLFAYDLVLHPDASGDDDAIKEGILRRYKDYFVLLPELALE